MTKKLHTYYTAFSIQEQQEYTVSSMIRGEDGFIENMILCDPYSPYVQRIVAGKQCIAENYIIQAKLTVEGIETAPSLMPVTNEHPTCRYAQERGTGKTYRILKAHYDKNIGGYDSLVLENGEHDLIVSDAQYIAEYFDILIDLPQETQERTHVIETQRELLTECKELLEQSKDYLNPVERSIFTLIGDINALLSRIDTELDKHA